MVVRLIFKSIKMREGSKWELIFKKKVIKIIDNSYRLHYYYNFIS